MNHDDERDHAEEADNKAAMVAEGEAESRHERSHMRACAQQTDLHAACTCEGLVAEMAKAEIARDKAVSALIDWVNQNYASIHQALEKMAERNEASAVEFADAPMVAKTLRESAASWRGMAGEMGTLVNAVWDTTPGV